MTSYYFRYASRPPIKAVILKLVMKANHVFDTIYGQNFFSNVPASSYRASVFICVVESAIPTPESYCRPTLNRLTGNNASL